MVAALWSNPNWDDTKESQGNRKKAIDGINENFSETLEYVQGIFARRGRPVEEEPKLADNNPFFAAAERGLEKVDEYIEGKRNSGKQIQIQEKEVEYMKDVDQG